MPDRIVPEPPAVTPEAGRAAVLGRLRGIVGEGLQAGLIDRLRVFCIEDGTELVAQYWQPEGYEHDDHRSPRAFLFTPTTRFSWRADGELVHESVGAVLWRDEPGGRRYCLFRRRAHPTGWYTIPAGHLEAGEDPCAAMRREVFEETGLAVLSAELLYEGELREECRRGSDYHLWQAWCCEAIGEPCISEEADVVGWYSRLEIMEELPLILPAGVFFEKLFGERPRRVRAG